MWHAAGGWEHRAYWGANTITYGENNSPGRQRLGDLPPVGKWVKLSVPASTVGLTGTEIDGVGFAHIDGRATWGAAGRTAEKK